ncbi:hypothetical protein DCAR_0518776 [Daucus carota subsp. sativus]|uniref:Uncharacterized protein n=1 Tax=Daucus carota subsp. sativus TaxID=79200 RepID=A0A164XHA5_DAUCS|nr:hypothetical protein DCAR_0518776 [Daucus carota subsp. sativus]
MTEVPPSVLEDNAIGNKGFYLYPLGTSNNAEPQLLDLYVSHISGTQAPELVSYISRFLNSYGHGQNVDVA